MWLKEVIWRQGRQCFVTTAGQSDADNQAMGRCEDFKTLEDPT